MFGEFSIPEREKSTVLLEYVVPLKVEQSGTRTSNRKDEQLVTSWELEQCVHYRHEPGYVQGDYPLRSLPS